MLQDDAPGEDVQQVQHASQEEPAKVQQHDQHDPAPPTLHDAPAPANIEGSGDNGALANLANTHAPANSSPPASPLAQSADVIGNARGAESADAIRDSLSADAIGEAGGGEDSMQVEGQEGGGEVVGGGEVEAAAEAVVEAGGGDGEVTADRETDAASHKVESEAEAGENAEMQGEPRKEVENVGAGEEEEEAPGAAVVAAPEAEEEGGRERDTELAAEAAEGVDSGRAEEERGLVGGSEGCEGVVDGDVGEMVVVGGVLEGTGDVEMADVDALHEPMQHGSTEEEGGEGE